MSSRTRSPVDWTAWAVLALCLGAVSLYAREQLLLSLLFFYRLLQYLLPS